MTGDPPIAVVGMGGLFPQAPDLATFLDNILHKVDAAGEVPAGRWALDPEVVCSSAPAPDMAISSRACLVEPFSLDTEGLQIDRELISRLDPMYQMVLHVGKQAFGDAVTSTLDAERVGVVLAAIALPTDASSAITREVLGRAFERRLFGNGDVGPSARDSATDALNSRVVGMPAGLLATALGLGGGSCTLDAACASSLYAVKLACEELRAHRADAMLAGGVSRPECLYTQVGFSQLRALSPSGTCRPFDDRADGLVVGEGAGILLLKRVDDAVRDGDRMYGLIRGVGLSNDIAGSLLAADSDGQLRAMRQAYEQAGWSPEDVDLIECHGTGTPLGDAVEIESLRSLWGEGTSGWSPRQCALGSVKSMIGHLLTAAGAAGLIKTLLAMNAKRLPPSANFVGEAPGMDLDSSPFRVQTEAEVWHRRGAGTPRRAAVSAFGFGGINAHLLVQEWDPAAYAEGGSKSPVVSVTEARPPVAVVGMDARFGEVESLRAFQELVLNGDSVLGCPPSTRWRGCAKEVLDLLDRAELPGAYIDSVRMAVGEFRLPPNEIPETLPQQLLMLQVVAGSLQDAGMPSRKRRERAGVVIGIGLDLNTSNYHQRWVLLHQARRWAGALGVELGDAELSEWVDCLRDEMGPPLNAGRVLGSLGGIIASRIAREFSFGGPSFAISGEEASGVRALEVAFRALQRREMDTVVVGAVDFPGDPRSVVTTGRIKPFSSSGRIRPFDVSADGTLPGEGAAALVLKRLDDAIAAGDRIYATVRGLGVSSGAPITSCSVDGYGLALRRAYQDAGVPPSSVSLIETHGGGVPEEDRVEAKALVEFFGQAGTENCALGSAKPNIGHTGAVAGLASVVKASLCLYQEMLPPLTGYQTCLEQHAWGEQVFHMPREGQAWIRNRSEGPRRAGVSVMAVDGNCAHVVLEGFDQVADGEQATRNAPVPDRHEHAADSMANARPLIERRQPLGRRRLAVFDLAAETTAGLCERLDVLAKFASDASGGIEQLARRWHRRGVDSNSAKLAVAIVASDRDGVLASIAEADRRLRSRPSDAIHGDGGVYHLPNPLGREGEVAFVFPGSGNHYLGMGTGIGAAWPEIVRAIDGQVGFLKDQLMPQWYAPWRDDWSKGWQASAAARIREEPLRMIVGQVAHGATMSDLLCHLGVQPNVVIGYSLGETAGLFATRAWRERDEMLARMRASTLFQSDLVGRCDAARKAWRLPEETQVDWRVAVLNRPAGEVRQAVLHSRHAYLLITNAPDECVVGGSRGDIEDLIITLGCEAIDLQGTSTVHCPVAGEVEDAYRRLHLLSVTAPDGIRFYSAAAAAPYALTEEDAADSIVRQALGGFDFPAVIERAYADGVRVFIEPGPQSSCTRMIGKILCGRPHHARSACERDRNDVETVLHLAAALIAQRVLTDLGPLYGLETRVAGHVQPADDLAGKKWIEVFTGGRAPDPKLPAGARVGFDEVVAETDRAVSEISIPEHTSSGVQIQAPAATADGETPESLGAVVAETEATVVSAHESFLKFSREAMGGMGDALALQARVLEAIAQTGEPVGHLATKFESRSPAPFAPTENAPAYPRELCMEFATGSVAKVLGPEFSDVDTYDARVRLPDEPLMLVDRILSVEGEKASLKSGRIVTEHDVSPDAWYLDGGRMPISLTVEAGQADLFLCSYLGIDLVVKGERVYRLLDATVRFHRRLPGPGEVIRYDIRIDRFVRQGETYLFFFSFQGLIGGQPVLSMDGGCAGFFTDDEIANSGGIIETEEESTPRRGRRAADRIELVPMSAESYTETQVDALRNGDLSRCFGECFDGLALQDPVRLPSGRMRLVHRVVELDPGGGRFGMGLIRAEADVHSDDWFLTCHFVDDMVMPGTLMYECCAHTLRIFLMRLGWLAEHDQVCYEPVENVSSTLRCRGPVTPATRVVTYEVHVKELGYGPEPFALADSLMYADGAKIVRFTDMSLKMTGATREQIESLWSKRSCGSSSVEPIGAKPVEPGTRAALYDSDRILAFAVGKPSEAFGEPYKPFDESRRIARLPGPPYQLIDRITEIHTEPWRMTSEGWVEGQYDVPADAWYFKANRQSSMPFAVLIEVGLQTCGWLAAFKGSALRSENDLSFRNLGGAGTLHEEVFPDAGPLTTRVRMTHVSEAGGMIIQKFDMQIWQSGRCVYECGTEFGFFTQAALAQQIGVRDAAQRAYVPPPAELHRGRQFALERVHPLTPDDHTGRPGPTAALPAGALLMIDNVDCLVSDGGPHGLGFIRGTKTVDAGEWFFVAHFFQDPVCPGSLGLESFLQLLKIVALDRWGPTLESTHRFAPMAIGVPHKWTYRGQILPANGVVEVDAIVTGVTEEPTLMLRADGFLKVDGVCIYEMKDFTTAMIPVT